MNSVILVEDSKEIYQMVAQSCSHLTELTWVKTLEEARIAITTHGFQLMILDVDLPDGNGIEFCSSIQTTHAYLPIFFLTGHNNLSDKVLGFTAGADDYITKPFSPLELRARIEAKLRKSKQQMIKSDSYSWQELQISKTRQEVFIIVNGIFKKVSLTALEFKILMYFAARPGEVIHRDKILNDIWGEDIHVYQRSVDTHVSKLRKKLESVSHIVESIHGSGYKFTPTPL